MSESVPPQVHQFILGHINSVAQLEMLLLLQVNPAQAWSAEQVARELRIEPRGAAAELDRLVQGGLVAREETSGKITYRYAPRTEDLAAGVMALAQAYLIRRVTVIGLIFSKPSDTIQGFADAFRLRKDEGSDG